MRTFRLTDRQKDAVALAAQSATHLMLFGGSRSGKTFIHLRNIVLRGMKAAGSRHAVLRFRFNHLKASVIHDTFPKMMEMCFPGVPWEIDRTDWYVTLPNGSQVWFGGLDDKDRVEKVLGQEYVTIFLNECSQISYEARNTALTRLAQNVEDVFGETMPPRMYYDCNPPSDAHWSYKLFVANRDPDTRDVLPNKAAYASMQMNPSHNLENLPPGYIETLESMPGRFRRRFLEGEYSDSNPSSLFAQETIDKWRVMDGSTPDMVRIIVSVDPSGASDVDNAANDEIGIVVGGIGVDGRGYLLEDLTMKGGPSTWGAAAVSAFHRHGADKIVAETNYGGAMVQHVIKTAAKGDRIPFGEVKASRGKSVRAEPVSALYENGEVRHVGNFPMLEDELCAFTTFGYTGPKSPNRADAVVWLWTELFPGIVNKRKEKPKVKLVQHQQAGSGGWMGA